MNHGAISILARLLEARTGQHIGEGRLWRVEASLRPLLREHGLESLDALVASLIADRSIGLADEIVDALLNNETFFFRDRQSFELLLGPGLDRLRAARARTRRLAIWCAGCSSGQEAYSIAMTIAGQKARWHGWTIEILGTDVSRTAIDRAIRGVYTQFEVQRGLAVTQMMRWFEQLAGSIWRIDDSIRRSVRFEVRSLIDAPPQPRPFDLILCRNVLLYFPAETRRRAFDRLFEAASEDSLLMLGAAETVIGQTERFVSDPDCRGLYFRRGDEAKAMPDRVRIGRAAS
jgi:chemotaxis protein methyltransferase CheR